MLIDFQNPILDLKGEPLKLAEKPFVLLNACQEALIAQFQDETNLPAADKVRRFALAMKIDNKLPVDISIEEAAVIKKLVGKLYNNLVVGRVYEIIDGAGTPPAPMA
jgi:hypothetical protein